MALFKIFYIEKHLERSQGGGRRSVKLRGPIGKNNVISKKNWGENRNAPACQEVEMKQGSNQGIENYKKGANQEPPYVTR